MNNDPSNSHGPASESEIQTTIENLGQTAQKTATKVSDAAEKTMSAAKEKFADFSDQALEYTRENPFPATMIAFGIGLLVGLSYDLHCHSR